MARVAAFVYGSARPRRLMPCCRLRVSLRLRQHLEDDGEADELRAARELEDKARRKFRFSRIRRT